MDLHQQVNSRPPWPLLGFHLGLSAALTYIQTKDEPELARTVYTRPQSVEGIFTPGCCQSQRVWKLRDPSRAYEGRDLQRRRDNLAARLVVHARLISRHGGKSPGNPTSKPQFGFKTPVEWTN